MEGESSKRFRNFTDVEKNMLFDLIIEHRDVIEKKKKTKCKREKWLEIINNYINNCQTGSRTAKQLQALYDTKKKKGKIFTTTRLELVCFNYINICTYVFIEEYI
ncbi:unnamed protein product [Psylliodes chrysocephalus]|uniref:Regulatory protein zeste n=1 Tax=Psylliodes chrysocephalus TaxID=3402493 RepID=A0A9P0CLS6_9CUCU|nr:unnamed protein product [Psylliodes chrysocephala]